MFERIVIEAEKPGDSRSLFRLQVDGHLIGKGLTVGQAQLLLREVVDRINPRRPRTRRAALLTAKPPARPRNRVAKPPGEHSEDAALEIPSHPRR